MSKLESFGSPYGGRPVSRSSYGHPMEEDQGFQFLHTELDFNDIPDPYEPLPAERLFDADFMNKFDDDCDDSDMIYDPIQRR
eukprot:jgi/Botrbrau1/16008/Bobra.0353s0006.1